MGRVIAPYGIKGWVKIQPFTASPDTLLRHTTWQLQRAGSSEKTTLTLAEGKMHGAFLVVLFSGFNAREDAEALKGFSVVMDRENLPQTQPDEFYCADLVGATVLNRENIVLGKISAVQSYGAQPILHIEATAKDGAPSSTKPREILIPFVAPFIDRVALDEERIYVDWNADWNE